jgi:hypothetical protein
MKTLLAVLTLLSMTAYPVSSQQSSPPSSVDLVTNTSAADWQLQTGWTWSDGALTHSTGSGSGAAQLVTMPAMAEGREYRASFTVDGSTQGRIRMSLGGGAFDRYGSDNATFEITLQVSDPNDLLTFTPTPDYDGTISSISVVEVTE